MMKSSTTVSNQNYQNSNTNDVLANFDFTEIEEKDPSLSEGHRLLYDREVPFELRLEDQNGPQEVASFEAIRCKILLGGEENNPSQIRIELSCENDLFFHFTSDIDEEAFKVMQENQKLTVNFNEYSNLTKRLLNNCINEPQSSDDTVRKQIAYRYNALRSKLELMQNRIANINNIVKLKNPSLLLQIQKAPAKLNNSTMRNSTQH